MTHYEVLEVMPTASTEVIKMAYKALTSKYHPDVFQGNKEFAEMKMKRINEAYRVLSSPILKQEYDDLLKREKEFSYNEEQFNQAYQRYYTNQAQQTNQAYQAPQQSKQDAPQNKVRNPLRWIIILILLTFILVLYNNNTITNTYFNKPQAVQNKPQTVQIAPKAINENSVFINSISYTYHKVNDCSFLLQGGEISVKDKNAVIDLGYKRCHNCFKSTTTTSNSVYNAYKEAMGSNSLTPVIEPLSGAILSGQKCYDGSELTIKASSGSSCVVKLKTASGVDRMSFYVRSGETITVVVPAEKLYVYFASGDTWYGSKDLFGDKTYFSMDDELLDFSRYTFEYTLYPVSSGNFTETPIDASQF